HREALVAPMRALGPRVSVGSLDNIKAIAEAAQGAKALYHICPNVSPSEVTFARAVIAGIERAGLRRFVFHSVLHPQIEAMPHHWEKMRVEEILFASGLDVTVLQPTAYMQNMLATWPTIMREGVYRVPYPAETRISLVDLEDVAEAAVRVLTEASHIGATYELVGTPPYSQTEAVEILAAALGLPVRAETETIEAWAARARAAGMGDYQRETLAAMFRYYARHGLVGNINTLRWLLGREPTSLNVFAKRAAAQA
ncbi:MAG: NmrA family NAD(P)-binding protein, partial [Pseudolabrys sp.]